MSRRERKTNGVWARIRRGWYSKPTAIGAVVILVLVVIVMLASTVLGIFAPVTDGQTDSPASAPATEDPAPAAEPLSHACHVAVTDTSSKPDIPVDLTFKTGAAGITWPVSKTVGPTTTIDGFDSCFARSPLGAALAAQSAIYSQYDPAHSVTDSLNHYIADSPGKATSVALSAKNNDADALRRSGMNPAGFVVDAFAQDRADLTLVFSRPDSPTGYVGIPCSVVWVNDDWRIHVLDNGELASGRGSTPSKGAFVAWEGGQR
ncbi:hypothetical protein ABUV18_03027 (plasmid) [Clavibacter nebraskensis]|uniref:hypothetical protein n=1 Tax=Clavibacter nebraskensis TaxID=31963 RepID=UPI003DA7580E